MKNLTRCLRYSSQLYMSPSGRQVMTIGWPRGGSAGNTSKSVLVVAALANRQPFVTLGIYPLAKASLAFRIGREWAGRAVLAAHPVDEAARTPAHRRLPPTPVGEIGPRRAGTHRRAGQGEKGIRLHPADVGIPGHPLRQQECTAALRGHRTPQRGQAQARPRP